MLRLVYLGTPAFAVPTLEAIVAAGHQVLAAVTQPDRPKGRGNRLAASPVKDAALRLGIPVFQPERIRRPEALEHLRALAPDAMVVVGYGQIIPQSIIDLAPRGIVNVHASLLPKYRGAAPVQWAIVNGETRTGVTTMLIDAGLDTGAMLLKAETEIAADETAVELGARLAQSGAQLLVETLARLDSIAPEAQDPAEATYAPILKKEDGRIDWMQAARRHSQPRTRPSTLAGSLHRFSRPDAAHLEIRDRGRARCAATSPAAWSTFIPSPSPAAPVRSSCGSSSWRAASACPPPISAMANG